METLSRREDEDQENKLELTNSMFMCVHDALCNISV